MPEYIYSMYRLSKHVPPDRDILRDISLSFYYGAKIGVLGPNGAGKSTLLRIMAGVETEYEGEAQLADGATVGLLEQEPTLDPDKSVRDNVMDGMAATRSLLDEYNEVLAAWADPEADYDELGKRQGALEKKIEAANAWDLDRNVEMAMAALRVPPGDRDVTTLSGGERRRVALCRLLLSHPDLLLLDEPTNHLDAESVAWLERFLADYTGTVVAVTHDRYFLDNVARWILELDRGRGRPFEGNYSAWLEQKQARLDQEEKEQSNLRRTIERELEWVRMSPRARQAKGKARLGRYEQLVSQAQEMERGPSVLSLTIPFTQRLGDKVIVAKDLTKGYDFRVLIDDLDFDLPPAGIVGIVGPNGAGKTTLFRMLTGAEGPDGGTIEIGPTVDLAYVDQHRDNLDPDKTIYQEISGGNDLLKIGRREINARAYVASLNFRGPDQQKKVGTLSGGERNRVHLGVMLRDGGNVILLDEPSNDLDVDTLRALEEALLEFPGCALVISHDRWFLDRICTHLLAFDGDGTVTWFPGNWSEYEEWSTGD
ncbi:MAG: energy-dependent translational throttle protein EttA [Acidimicrobiia bacterium]|nr:energy-dependent translational throttle protein EttA [Acidimicrobiia bacterium]